MDIRSPSHRDTITLGRLHTPSHWDTFTLRHLYTGTPGHHHTGTPSTGTPSNTITLGTPSHRKPHTGTPPHRDTLTSLLNFRVSNSVVKVIMLAKLMLIVGTGAANILLGLFFCVVVIFTLTQKNKVFFSNQRPVDHQ